MAEIVDQKTKCGVAFLMYLLYEVFNARFPAGCFGVADAGREALTRIHLKSPMAVAADGQTRMQTKLAVVPALHTGDRVNGRTERRSTGRPDRAPGLLRQEDLARSLDDARQLDPV